MKYGSNGEVFGSKALNLAIIGTSVFILMGMLYQPAAHSPAQAGKAPAAHVEQVVDTAHGAPAVSG